ncbi:hypothetical protein LSTR_LSTR005800 [Laodelphax striatellus]|uniref:MADF domain-containing protein n=1 Tax=Laodelphax striatellus TaxID=195883 RepID=A0A482X0P1_LAOST|nr:hypothetical protein LSTR_LSTR005800 [Laodelphax striatellus]
MFDTEKFIKEVELRPIVYNTYNKDYYNKELKQKSWYEIGNAMFDDWETLDDGEKFDTVVDLMKKWRFIRDAFVRSYKATVLFPKYNTNRKKYVFFDQLQFLLPISKGLKNAQPSDDENPDSSLCSTPDISEIFNNSTGYCDESGSKKARNIFPRKISNTCSVLNRKSPGQSLSRNGKESCRQRKRIKKEEDDAEDSDQYGHSSFLASFVPVLCSMPINEAMQIRQRISEIFSEHFSKQGSNS